MRNWDGERSRAGRPLAAEDSRRMSVNADCDGFTYLDVTLEGAPGEDGNLGLTGGQHLGVRHLDRLGREVEVGKMIA